MKSILSKGSRNHRAAFMIAFIQNAQKGSLPDTKQIVPQARRQGWGCRPAEGIRGELSTLESVGVSADTNPLGYTLLKECALCCANSLSIKHSRCVW